MAAGLRLLAGALGGLRLLSLGFRLANHDGDLRERLHDREAATTAASREALHDQVLADVGLGHDQGVDVELMVVLGVGNGAHHALADVLSDTLPRELEIGERLVDLLAADETGDEVQLLRRYTKVLRDRARLFVGEAPFAARLAHYFLVDAFLSPPCPGKDRVGENSPSLWPIMSSVTFTGTCFWPL